MDILLSLVLLSPIVVLIVILVRYGYRIRQATIDQQTRMGLLEELHKSLVTNVLERDQHTCQMCGTTDRVGVDFRGETPESIIATTADDLEARCAVCFLDPEGTRRSGMETTGEDRR
jgi:hypothetical protein